MAHQSGPLLQAGWAPCLLPQSPDGNPAHPTPPRNGTWLPAAACPALAVPEAPALRGSAGCGDARLPPRCTPALAEAQAPGARQPTTLQRAGGEGGRRRSRLQKQDDGMLSWKRRKHHAHQEQGSLLRDPREPQGMGQSPLAAAAHCPNSTPPSAGVETATVTPALHQPYLRHPTLKRVLHPSWYHLHPCPHC